MLTVIVMSQPFLPPSNYWIGGVRYRMYSRYGMKLTSKTLTFSIGGVFSNTNR